MDQDFFEVSCSEFNRLQAYNSNANEESIWIPQRISMFTYLLCMEVSPFCTANLCFNPLCKQENINALTLLLEIVKTCIGPRGKLKLIRNSSGGHTTVTSSSCRLFQSLSVKNHFNRMILASVKSHLRTFQDGGLLSAFFPLSLIHHSLSCDIQPNLKASLYEHFLQAYVACLNSAENGCVWKIDLSNGQLLRSIVRTIVSSKLECLLSSSQKDHVCAVLIETFLNVFPSGRLNFHFLTFEGRDTKESRWLNGLFLHVPKIDWMRCPHLAKVALFTLPLAPSEAAPLQDAALKQLEGIVAKLILLKIDLVLCQKVVDPHVKKQLNDAGVIVLDQLGTETTTFLQYMLDDCVNSTLHDELLCFNFIECTKEEIGSKHYVALRKKDVCTLLICHYNQEYLSELKVVCEQAVAALFRLLRNPKVCFGAGCTDIFTALLFTKQIKNELKEITTKFGCTNDKILSVLNYFLLSISDIALSSHQQPQLNFAIDCKYGHLWNTNHKSDSPDGNQACCCGHHKISNTESSRWNSLSDLMHISVPESDDKPSFEEPCIIDEFSCKLNAITAGGEVALSLIKTHLCIFTRTNNVF